MIDNIGTPASGINLALGDPSMISRRMERSSSPSQPTHRPPRSSQDDPRATGQRLPFGHFFPGT